MVRVSASNLRGGLSRAGAAVCGRCAATAAEVGTQDIKEYFLTFRPRAESESADELYERIADHLERVHGTLVQERCYAASAIHAQVVAARERVFVRRGVEAEGAFCFVGQDSCGSSPIGGVQLWAVDLGAAGGRCSVRPLALDGRVVGREFRGENGTYVLAPSIGPHGGIAATASLKDRAVSMFEEAGRILRAVGLTYRDVARTWIYLPELLSWYGDFNAARRHAYKDAGLLDSGKPIWLPASTGIQGRCPRGRDCMMDFLALRGRAGRSIAMTMVRSPRQCEAFDYGSSFARAVEIKDGASSRVYVSGTASIDEAGKTVYAGDFEKQTRHTLSVVGELLKTRGHTFADLAQAIVFLKRASDVEAWRRIGASEGLDCEPCIETVADVCRDDLLIEVEMLTVRPAIDLPAAAR